MKGLRRAISQRPSRFERADTYAIISGLAADIEKTAAEFGIQLPSRPTLGTLPLGQLNAMAIRVPDTRDFIIVFQTGVFGFLNLLSKVVAASMPSLRANERILGTNGSHFPLT
jgi:hypothetical protein